MGIIEIFFIGIGLAMDAFAVSVCKGLSMKKINWNKAIIIALYFGIFQALMPIIGYLLGSTFETLVKSIDHWISFILLVLIGGNMIREALEKEKNTIDDSINFKTMIILAIATSIDALTIGITFAFLKTNIFLASLLIGLITFIMSLVGVTIGNKFGDKYDKIAEITGGIILILLGLKILLEHLDIINF